MKTQEWIRILEKIRKSYGDDIFLSAGRLCSYVSDMAEGRTVARENSLIKVGYRLAEKEMNLLIRELCSKGNKITECTVAAGRAMVEAFMPEEEVCRLLEAILGAFGENFGTDRRTPAGVKEIHVQELKKALTALDDKYQDNLWRDGKVLASLLADQDSSLITERRLIERVYAICGSDIRKLVRCIVKGEDPEEQIAGIQKSLREEYVADQYIDGFLISVLELFGKEYKNPLIRPASVGAVYTSNLNKGVTAGKPNNLSKSGSSTGNSSIGGGTSTGNVTGGQTIKKKKGGKIIPLLVLCILAAVILPSVLNRNDETDQMTGENTVQDVNVSGETADDQPESEQEEIADDQLESEQEEIEEDTLYIPQSVSSVQINAIDSTVYGENVTDLHNYVKYKAQGKNFVFGFPVGLYEKVDFVGSQFIDDDHYLFTGTDGSSLEYECETLSHRYTSSEWREERVSNFTSGMSDVSMLSFDDGEDEGYFFLYAKERNLDVYIAGYLNVAGGPADYMIVKVPEAANDEDRLIKNYYVETLCCLAEFFDSEGNGMSLRSYEDFLVNQ